MPGNDFYSRIIESPVFTFAIGEEKVPVIIHTELVEAHSRVFYRMTEKREKDSLSAILRLRDVDVDTFIAFCEYIYSGTYTVPNPGELEEDEKTTPPATNPGAKSTRIVKRYRGEDSKLSRLRQIYAKSASESGLNGEKLDDYFFTNLWEAFTHRHYQYDGIPVVHYEFTSHVKLHRFCSRFMIGDLHLKCMASLHLELCSYSLSTENSQVIVDLLEYVYVHTPLLTPDFKSELRDLVIHYVACKLPILGENDAFWTILKSNVQVATDLVMEFLK